VRRKRGRAMEKTRGSEKARIRRFSGFRIAEHWVMIFTTVVLFATGLTQRFWSFDSAQWFILKMGGIDSVRLIHRYTGLVFSLQLFLHVGVGIMGVMTRRMQPSMMINSLDVRDAVHNIKYYFGLENKPAMCGRYDYMEKFEYWTILVGGFLMVMTGAILWLPLVITRYFPGEAIPAAKALHSNEALMIFLINAIWHIFNAVFSPEVFPLDTSIFSGYISRERMVREHPVELARLEGVSLEEVVKADPRRDDAEYRAVEGALE
jgi:formate dehydrogenase gamma subunit